MSDALSDDGHGFWRFCPRDVSAYSLVCAQDAAVYTDLESGASMIVRRQDDKYTLVSSLTTSTRFQVPKYQFPDFLLQENCVAWTAYITNRRQIPDFKDNKILRKVNLSNDLSVQTRTDRNTMQLELPLLRHYISSFLIPHYPVSFVSWHPPPTPTFQQGLFQHEEEQWHVEPLDRVRRHGGSGTKSHTLYKGLPNVESANFIGDAIEDPDRKFSFFFKMDWWTRFHYRFEVALVTYSSFYIYQSFVSSISARCWWVLKL